MMDLKILGTLFVAIFTILITSNGINALLTFPRTSPTRAQLIAGIGIPVDLEFESVTIGYVFKAEYFLPENASNFFDILADPFNPTVRPITGTGRKKRSDNRPNLLTNSNDNSKNIIDSPKIDKNYERYEVEAVEIENKISEESVAEDAEEDDEEDWDEPENDLNEIRIKQPNDFSKSRWTLYKGIEHLAKTKGLEGRACMLRSICESAHAPFSYSSGILGELMHIIMSPSTSPDNINDHSDNEYLRAEELGKSNAPCDKIFRECSTSILDQFSGIYSSLDNLIKILG